MKKVTIEDLKPPTTTSPNHVLDLEDTLDTTELAINYYELGTGDQFGFDLHRHLDQEEVFYVQQGTVTFETKDGQIDVSAGEVIRFAPGEFQIGRNLGDTKVVALALGVPKETEAIEYLRDCPSCEERTIQTPEFDTTDRVLQLHCAECDATVEEVPFKLL